MRALEFDHAVVCTWQPTGHLKEAHCRPNVCWVQLRAHGGDVMRGRYRNSLEKPEPIVANAVNQYVIAFPGNDHVFLKGHRVMAQVQSTWFPVIDRNPQKYVKNIYQANNADFQSATQRIFRSGKQASYIALPVVETH